MLNSNVIAIIRRGFNNDMLIIVLVRNKNTFFKAIAI